MEIITVHRVHPLDYEIHASGRIYNGPVYGLNKSIMPYFNGSLRLKILEAQDLRPTDFATRFGSKSLQLIDPYIEVDVDEVHVAKTTTKFKTFKPVWNEEFNSEVHNGQTIGLTVFHDAAIPPDEFVANCSVAFEDLISQQSADIWVRIHHTCIVALIFYINRLRTARNGM